MELKDCKIGKLVLFVNLPKDTFTEIIKDFPLCVGVIVPNSIDPFREPITYGGWGG
jgi:hypothetical protein